MNNCSASVHVTPRRRGFTLTELMVAVVVLLVIIVAVGRIFGTASEVVKNGEAAANILQETAAIEQLMRSDLDRISDQGFLVIQCVAVENNVMVQNGGGRLLDPTLPPDHVFRCDQIAFVVDDLAISRQTQSMGQFIENGVDGQGYVDYLGQTLPTPQSTSSVLYYGHGIQFPFLRPNLPWPVDIVPPDPSEEFPQDISGQPWFRPSPGQAGKRAFQRWPSGQSVQDENAAQPPASQWTLARQDTLLADDYDADPTHYLSKRTGTGIYRNAANQLFGPVMESGRVDVLSGDIGRLRDAVRGFPNPPQDIADLLFDYRPRAEKRPPTLDKSDVLLVGNVLGSNCSSFVVDWTWADGVGRDLELDLDVSPLGSLAGAMRGVSHRGGSRRAVGNEQGFTVTEGSGASPWFGLGGNRSGNPNVDVARAREWIGVNPPDGAPNFLSKRVRFYAPLVYDPANQIYGTSPSGGAYLPGATISPNVPGVVEGVVDSPMPGVRRYRAFFGLNGKEPFVRDGSGNVITTAAFGDPSGWPLCRQDYTPWPSALRITATFHDPRGVIEGGRTLQFVIPLPERVQDLPES